MSLETSALVLAWIAILLLAFAMSGLLRQIQAVRQQSLGTRPNLGLPEGSQAPFLIASENGQSRARLLCFVDTQCESCEPLMSDLNDYVESSRNSLEVIVVGRNPLERAPRLSSQIKFIESPHAFNSFRIPYVPVGVVSDRYGRILTTQPLGSSERLMHLTTAFHHLTTPEEER